MNRFIGVSSLFIFFCAIASNAQQNLFNIPSGDITRQGKFFYQHQLNIYNQFNSNTAPLVNFS
ncbi:MAG: hypothetical protein ACKO96_14940, partial [Flammeovirgaceae bacterium]